MASMFMPTAALVLSPEDRIELERRVAAAEHGSDRLPAPVVDLVAWLREKLETDAEATPVDAEDLADHAAAVAAAEDDLRNGRTITAEEYFAGIRHPG
jgi:hypothetical protein